MKNIWRRLIIILTDIKNWIVKQDYWQQVIAEKLLNEISITDYDIENFYQIFKKEKGLSSDELERDNIDFPTNKSENEVIKNIKWRGLANTVGVNAIKNGEKLLVGNQVTLVYGENGSGKSSYTRLLNNIFVSRGDKTLLPNLHAEDPENPSSTVIFENEDGFLEEIDYPEGKFHPFNNRVAVFDSQSAVYDLTQESELSFSPIEFKFFDQFIEIIEKIKCKFEEEIEGISTENYFINYFSKETSVKNIIEQIDSRTDINHLKNELKVSQEDINNSLENLNRKKQLEALNVTEKQKDYHNLVINLEDIKKKVAKLNTQFSAENLIRINNLIAERNRYKSFSLREGLTQFEDDNIVNLGSSEWKGFIEAALKYYQTFEKEVDYCIFCQQDNRETTVIDKYWKYLKSEVEKTFNFKNTEIEKELEGLINTDCSLYTRESKIDDWIQEENPELFIELTEGETKFETVRQIVMQALKSYESQEDIISYEMFFESINYSIDNIKSYKLRLNIEEVEKEIELLQSYEDDYMAKLQAEKLLSEIEKFIINIKWVEKSREYKINTKTITIFQNTLFTKYVTGRYITRFNEECKKLNAEFSAEIKQRGSKGSTLSKLTVKEKKPLEILSEGEQRSIALANFFAETSVHDNNVCLIFDDPVSSLDYKRRDIIVQRLIEEAQQKQVVILTHDLTFLLALQNRCEAQEIDYLSTTIRKIQTVTGIIDESLPWIGLSVKKRIGHLKQVLQQLKSKHKNITPDTMEDIELYESHAKLWCEKLRETWERSIEEILFNGSVQRFNPAIQTQRLRDAPFTPELYLEIERGMGNCSNWVHDRAAGLGEEVPSPEMLEGYLRDCDEFIKRVRK